MEWKALAQALYYAGAGAVLVATAFRYFYNRVRTNDKRGETLKEIEQIHLPAIYRALFLIAKKLGISLILPGYKPLPEDDEE